MYTKTIMVQMSEEEFDKLTNRQLNEMLFRKQCLQDGSINAEGY